MNFFAFSVATFLREIIAKTKLNSSFGIIQTAYANGSSTRYIKNKLVNILILNSSREKILVLISIIFQNIDVAFAKTGVKHLHQKAIEYDIGIYFESNGHGTIVFSKKLKNDIAKALETAWYEIFTEKHSLSC